MRGLAHIPIPEQGYYIGGHAQLKAGATTYREDVEFVARLVNRDCQAWHTFVKQFNPLIRRRISASANECRFTLSEHEIEDIYSEVLKALVARDMAPLRLFRGSSRFSTWLTVVVRRTALHWMNNRPADRARGQIGALSDRLNIPIEPKPAIDDLIHTEEFAQLRSLMHNLRDADRTILRFHFADGLSYQQISQRMSISVNAVGAKLHRAQQRLRQLARCHK